MLTVDQAMIGGVRLIENWKTIDVLLPGEITAIHDGSAEGRAVATHKLGERLHNNVSAEFDRPQQDRSSHRVIHDQRHSMSMGHPCQTFDVANIPRRVAYALAEHSARIVVHQPFY